MPLDLTERDRALARRGLREAVLQVKDGRRGALADVELLFDLALTGDRRLASLMELFLDDAEQRRRDQAAASAAEM